MSGASVATGFSASGGSVCKGARDGSASGASVCKGAGDGSASGASVCKGAGDGSASGASVWKGAGDSGSAFMGVEAILITSKRCVSSAARLGVAGGKGDPGTVLGLLHAGGVG